MGLEHWVDYIRRGTIPTIFSWDKNFFSDCEADSGSEDKNNCGDLSNNISQNSNARKYQNKHKNNSVLSNNSFN